MAIMMSLVKLCEPPWEINVTGSSLTLMISLELGAAILGSILGKGPLEELAILASEHFLAIGVVLFFISRLIAFYSSATNADKLPGIVDSCGIGQTQTACRPDHAVVSIEPAKS